jgi:SHS2 domain-containing protein
MAAEVQENVDIPSERRGYFDHDADVGVFGCGTNLEAAMVAAAESTFDLMSPLEGIRPLERVDVEFEESDVGFALVTWLNLLLAYAHERGLALGCFELHRSGDHWRGTAWGERWREAMPRGVDVKGATLTALSVRCTDGHWDARCVVDV